MQGATPQDVNGMAITYTNKDKTVVDYAGCVLATREKNYYDDSDFYAVVYDADKDRVITVTYASTRYAGGGDAVVDATPEIIQKAKSAWIREQIRNGSLKARIEAECQYPTLGKKVRVVRGRSDKGFEGELFWMREYAGYGYKTYIRVGVRNDIGDVAWVYHRNVDVVDPETISDEMIEHYLKNLADNGAFRNPSMMTNLLKGRALNNPVIA